MASQVNRPNTARSAQSSASRIRSRPAVAIRAFFGSRARRAVTSPSDISLPIMQPTAVQPIEISPLAKAFVDSLNAAKLSNFLIWYLYYDIIALPESPGSWYVHISNVDMRGWVALGKYLAKVSQSMNTSTGFDLVVLDSICDRLQLQRSTIHAALVQFADPIKMMYSQISILVNNARKSGASKLDTMELVQAKLQEMHKLATKLKPEPPGLYTSWKKAILDHVEDLLRLFVGPRIDLLRSGKPLVTVATSEQLSKEVTDGNQLAYQFEALQPRRTVPLDRYGIFPERRLSGTITSTTPTSSPTSRMNGMPARVNSVERARSHAQKLNVENRMLKAELVALKQENSKLKSLNAELAQRATGTQPDLEHFCPTETASDKQGDLHFGQASKSRSDKGKGHFGLNKDTSRHEEYVASREQGDSLCDRESATGRASSHLPQRFKAEKSDYFRFSTASYLKPFIAADKNDDVFFDREPFTSTSYYLPLPKAEQGNAQDSLNYPPRKSSLGDDCSRGHDHRNNTGGNQSRSMVVDEEDVSILAAVGNSKPGKK